MEKRKYRNKEWLTKKIEQDHCPVSDIAYELGVTKATIKRWANKFNIDRGTVVLRWIRAIGLTCICPKCKKEVPNAAFCWDCGANLRS